MILYSYIPTNKGTTRSTLQHNERPDCAFDLHAGYPASAELPTNVWGAFNGRIGGHP
ncbi:MAG TPA: hypothetical protein VGA56_20960 [Opitutaceae bacterium]